MWKHDKEAIAAVEEFNEKVCDVLGEERNFSADYMAVMETDGTQTLIRFMGVVLWDSENDGRNYLPKTEDSEYEPLLGFLQRRFKEEIEFFSRLLPKTEEIPERYSMCEDQPAQIDCRNTVCKWHVNAACTNVSPAITLSPQIDLQTMQPVDPLKMTATCWSYEPKIEDNGNQQTT